MTAVPAQEIATIVESLKAALGTGPVLELAVLFGSAAKGRLRRDSDLDVGIIPACDLTLRDELDLAAALSLATGREVDLVRLDQASTLVRWQVAKHHVPLFGRTASSLSHFLARAALDHADLAPLLEDASTRLRRRLARGAEPR